MTLTPLEKDFIKNHNLPISSTFNASGMRKKDYRIAMKELNKQIAYNTSPCKKYGHKLRTRSGHCVQCDTTKFAFLERYDSQNYLYIASSKKRNFHKVGLANDIREREVTLNRSGYGGTDDWKIQDNIFCDKAGRIENNIHKKLHEYNYIFEYFRRDFKVNVQCTEIFRVDYQIIKKVFYSEIKSSEYY